MMLDSERGPRLLERVHAWPSTVSIGNVLLGTVIGFNALLIAWVLVLIHYFGVDAITSLLYVGVESCDPDSMGMVGLHCFGDYNLGMILAMANPWDFMTQVGPWNYPPASMVLSHLFILFGDLINRPSAALVLYILIMAAGLTVGAVWASRGRALWMKLLIWSAFGFLSIPALMAIDRGNIVGYAAPFMFLAVWGIAKDKPLAVALGIALASCAKPQFGLAILIFAIAGRWLWLLICAGIAAVLHLAAFSFWPESLPGSVVQAVTGMFSFGGVSTLDVEIPVSVSFAKAAYLLEEWFLRPFTGSSVNWVEEHQGAVSFGIALALVVVLVICRRAIPFSLNLALLFLVSALSVPTSFTYYFIAAIPLAAIVLRDPDGGGRFDEPHVFRGVLEIGSNRRWRYFAPAVFFAVTLAGTISRVLYPQLMPSMPVFTYTTADFVTLLWMIAIPWYCLSRWSAYRSQNRQREAEPATAESVPAPRVVGSAS